MSAAIEQNCTFLISNDRTSGLQQEDICKDLETNEVEAKIRGLKNAIFALLSNENMPRVLMTVIRFCITQDDHTLKKLLMLYWEIVPKYSPLDKKLLPEMILVCNALRNDLLSPNEYVRGCMLRFLCKVKEAELLEPLIPAVKTCLEHRHSFVRRNAALAVYSINRHFGDMFLPDGAELIDKFIAEETDVSARRNAFLMLFNEAESVAVDYLSRHFEDISTYGDGFALLVLELARKVCRRDAAQKTRFVSILFALLKSDSLAVSYEAAWTLVSLSSAPTALRAAAQTYCSVLNTSSDVNVQLIVLERLAELDRSSAGGAKAVAEVVMDILRALQSPSLRILGSALSVALERVTPRTLEEVCGALRRECVRALESDRESGEQAAALLVSALHRLAVRFEEVALEVSLSLADLLGSAGGTARESVAVAVMQCVRAVAEQHQPLRGPILRKILTRLEEITSSEALRVALWMCGEYSGDGEREKELKHTEDSSEEVLLYETFECVRALIGDAPYVLHEKVAKVSDIAGPSVQSTKSVVLADGTYASVTTSAETPSSAGSSSEEVPHLRRMLCGGDVLLGSVCAAALTKMALRALSLAERERDGRTHAQANRLSLFAALCAAGVGASAERLRNARTPHNGSGDCATRCAACVRVLLDPAVRTQLAHTFTESCRGAYSTLLAKQRAAQKSKDSNITQNTRKHHSSRPDDLIQWRQLRTSQGVRGGLAVDLMDADDVSRAAQLGNGSIADGSSPVQRVHQLTGYSDPLYAEATVTVHDYDIVLDLLVLNRTAHPLSSVVVELATVGDLKVLERPPSLSLAPRASQRVRASVKVSSTETAHIFGAIAFECSVPLSALSVGSMGAVGSVGTMSGATAAVVTRSYVSLNDIQLDVMDYIRTPSAADAAAHCAPDAFRRMWAEFEWENKVAVNSNITDLYAFVQHVAQSTHMTVLTPLSEAEDLSQSNFLAANLYARSVFGEDVLVNVSVEKKVDAPADAVAVALSDAPVPSGTGSGTAVAAQAAGKLHGYIRIRSKTQGIALSLGDRITAVQRVQLPPAPPATDATLAETHAHDAM